MFICDESMQTHTITSIPEPENDFLKQTALHSLEKTPFHLHSNFLDRFYECCGRSGKWIFGFYFQITVMEEVGTSERLDEREKKNSSKTWKTPKNFDCFGIRTPNSMRLMKIRDLSFLDPFQL